MSRKSEFEKRFFYENQFYKDNLEGYVLGIDEVGRGPLAGPVIACAAHIDQDKLPLEILHKIQDSKLLKLKQREEVYEIVQPYAKWSIGTASLDEIDRYNILQASLMAMHRAYRQFTQTTILGLLIDGTHAPKTNHPYQTIIKGDQKSASIALASIMAKVTRDRIMLKLAEQYPDYGWESNSGYATKKHRDAIEKYGITPHHRKSFQPIKGILERQNSANLLDIC